MATGTGKRLYNDPEFWPEDDGDTYHDDEE
jgi:hypothetical protein